MTLSPRSFPSRLPCMHGLIVTLLILLAAGPARVQAADSIWLRSQAVLVVDQDTGQALISKNADTVMPIASLTKLMTALVVLDARLPLDEVLEISDDDVDQERHTRSRLTVGTRLSRGDMLLLALMASENRAAMALSRNYPGGRDAFIIRMNAKARALGMTSSHFADPAGLSNGTTSSARDLLRLVSAADTQSLIRRDSTQPKATVLVRGRRLTFISTNSLVRNNRGWDIELQKTGFTNEAGRCLVMRATTLNRRLSIIFLNSFGKLTRFADAGRIRQHLEHLEQRANELLQPTTNLAVAVKASS